MNGSKWIAYVQVLNTLGLAFIALYFGLKLIPDLRESDLAHQKEREEEIEVIKIRDAFRQREMIQNAEILSGQRKIKRELEDIDRLLEKMRGAK